MLSLELLEFFEVDGEWLHIGNAVHPQIAWDAGQHWLGKVKVQDTQIIVKQGP